MRLSPRSSKSVYEAGMETIPSESVCYPGKLVHGHFARLLRDGAPFIFYPCVPHSPREDKEARNHFNCPIVTSYPEVIMNNVELDLLELQVDELFRLLQGDERFLVVFHGFDELLQGGPDRLVMFFEDG